jgi:hypothetical protein
MTNQVITEGFESKLNLNPDLFAVANGVFDFSVPGGRGYFRPTQPSDLILQGGYPAGFIIIYRFQRLDLRVKIGHQRTSTIQIFRFLIMGYTRLNSCSMEVEILKFTSARI